MQVASDDMVVYGSEVVAQSNADWRVRIGKLLCKL